MNKNRRTFLKIMLIGGGTLIAGKILGPLFSSLPENQPAEKNSPSFKIKENNRKLSIYDNSGEEVFQIDKSE